MMKRLLAMLLIVAMVCTMAFALTACDGSTTDDPLDETIDPTQGGSKIDVPGPEDPDASKDADGAYIHSK